MDLLIEFFCEEIPARMQRDAELNGKNVIQALLQKEKLTYSKIFCFVSPRRIALIVLELPDTIASFQEEKRGPRIAASKEALDGFLKATNTTIEDLRVSDGYYYIDIFHPEKNLKEFIHPLVVDFLNQMPWPKTMRWYNSQTKSSSLPWIRPVRNVVCMLDKELVCISLKEIGLQTNSRTLGHRFFSNHSIVLKSPSSYEDQMEKENVIVCFEKRKNMIAEKLREASGKLGLLLNEDDELLDEVTGLVEYPHVTLETIPDHFMTLPQEILITSMRTHQKYFSFSKKDGSLANYFGLVTNVPCPPDAHVMRKGFKRVLQARLSDAQFFYDHDMKTPLEDLTQQYDKVIFHEELGTLKDKIDRLLHVIRTHNDVIPLSDLEKNHLEIACTLSKADLFTSIVREFPELQGFMGHICALKQGRHPDIAHALEYYYQPLGPFKNIPLKPVSRCLAFLDKMDTLIGFFGKGIKPTGSKDPLALRRTALGIIRLMIEWPDSPFDHPTDNPLFQTLSHAFVTAYQMQNRPLSTSTLQDVEAFIQTRFKIYLESKNKESMT